MFNNSSQKFIARNRAPRVQIEYDVEIYGSEKKIELPFVMGVLADLSGKPVQALPPVGERKFLDIDIDNFDERMKAIQPRVAFAVPNTLSGAGQLMVDITFESIDDFSPAAVARKIEPLRQLLDARTHLNDDAPTLQPLLRVLDLFLPPPAPAPATGVADLAGTARLSATAAAAHPLLPFAGAPLPASSAPASRDDVLVTLRAARQWFEAHEPSSPVAVLLKQAERMVGKRFSQVADAIPLDLLHKWESADDDGSRTGGRS